MQAPKRFKKLFSFLTVFLFLLIFSPFGLSGVQPANGTIIKTVTALTLNGYTSVSVFPHQSIVAAITVRAGSGSHEWSSTKYQIGSGSGICRSRPSHSNGTFTESFSFTGPINPGTYTFTVKAYHDNNCNEYPTTPYSLVSAIVVTNTYTDADVF